MKRITFLAAIIAGFFLFGAQSAFADSCAAGNTIGGNLVGGECQITGAHAVSGTLQFDETLHMLSGAAWNASASGVVVNVGDSTHPGNMVMEKNSKIFANGDNISVNVPNGDMTMLGSPLGPGSTDKCGYPVTILPSNTLGAQITSLPASILTTITINVGNYPSPQPPGNLNPPLGSFLMERCSVVSVSTGGTSAGTVKITVGHEADLDGLVLSESTLSGTGANQAPGGGPITVQTGCVLTVSSEGVVSSKGHDPGADLVHLEGCDVFIDGLVQSTGPGHVPPNNPKNHCITGVHSGKPANSTACIEIIGQNITISKTGEVNADVNNTGSGGPQGTSWIDLFAYDDIKITGRTGATDPFSVHANTASGTDTTPNTITAMAGFELATPGTFSGTGKILAASIIGAANGSYGGAIVVQAAGAVNLDDSTVKAAGDNAGGTQPPCDSGSGACGRGGTISVQSFNAGISWQNGVGNVNPDVGASPPAGAIFLTSCTALPGGIDTTGTNFDNAVPTKTGGVGCGSLPPFPAYIVTAFGIGDPIWDACLPFEAHKSGMKFNDRDNSGDFSAGDTPIPGWPINLLTVGNVLISTTHTDALGNYHFDFLAPGTFRVCEGTESPVTDGFVQTFPHAGVVHPGETVISTCPAPSIWGYQFTVVNGSNFTEDNFGNNKPSHKSGKKFDDKDSSGDFSVGDTPIAGWPINLYKTSDLVNAFLTTTTDANGNYKFTIPAAGEYQACEGQKAGVTSTQTYPNALTPNPLNETVVNTCPGPNNFGYKFTVDSGNEFVGDDFGNHTTGAQCPEDPTAVLTSTVDPSGTSHGGVPNFLTLQPAYDAAANNAVIGLFGKWKENVNLGGAKTLKITQCTSAEITAADSSLPVWNITSTGKLLIQGPDSVGGTIGWLIANAPGTGPHTLKSVRANGASQYGILIMSSNNSVSWNDVSGNGLVAVPGAGVRVEVGAKTNTLKGGTTGPNNGDGVQLAGDSNTLSGATVNSNTGNGVAVTGSNNTIQGNNASLNTLDGFNNVGGAINKNKYSGNSSNKSGANGLHQYEFTAAGVNGGSNRADGVNVPSASKCSAFATAISFCD